MCPLCKVDLIFFQRMKTLFVLTVETIQFVFMPTASCTVYYAAAPGGISFISIIFIISGLITAFNYTMKSNILITESTLVKVKGQTGAKRVFLMAFRIGVADCEALSRNTIIHLFSLFVPLVHNRVEISYSGIRPSTSWLIHRILESSFSCFLHLVHLQIKQCKYHLCISPALFINLKKYITKKGWECFSTIRFDLRR